MIVSGQKFYFCFVKKNIVIILSNINRAISHEWTIESLNPDKFTIYFVLMNPWDSEIEKYLIKKSISYLRINYHSKRDLPKSILAICKFLIKNKIQIVHTHLFDANIAGLIAAKLVGIKKRIYTRHHSTYHHDYFPKAVKYDRMVNYLATDIIAISANVKDVLLRLEGADKKKIHLVYHGFNMTEFNNVSDDRVNDLKNKYHINDRYPVIGLISRFTRWKGIQYAIPAFQKLLNDYPNALLVLANTSGEYALEINKMLSRLDKRNFVTIKHEYDFMALYHLFDFFVHVPINKHAEAFGQTYVEALAFGIPSVFTLSGIACEFIIDRQNALVVKHESSDEIYYALQTLLKDHKICQKLIIQGRTDVSRLFSLEKMIQGFEKIYLS